jgi:hypothetical protein
LSVIDTSAAATTNWNASPGMSPRLRPSVARMNENSPTWVGQLRRGACVRDDARRERSDHDTCQQVADDRRQAQAVRDDAADEPGPEADGDGLDQRRRVIHPRIVVDAIVIQPTMASPRPRRACR